MRIAQVAPLIESVPPRTYGGTERIVHYLTEELQRQGCEVTLFASGDSITSARHVAIVDHSLRTGRQPRNEIVWHQKQLMRVVEMSEEFDIIHFHTDVSHYPVARLLPTPSVTTLHGRLDMFDYDVLLDEFDDSPVVSISHAQRRPVPNAYWAGTVYNGIRPEEFTFQPERGDYLAFVGRFSCEKGPERAIEIAKRLQIPLKMAAKIDNAEIDHFRRYVEPHLDHPLIEYVGEVDLEGKNELLGGALATLFPINWPEPFGLVMIESMACGTPVIAFRNGSVDEVMEDGVTGFIVESIDAAMEAVAKIPEVDRKACRESFLRRFTVERMTAGYLDIYRSLLQRSVTLPIDAYEPRKRGGCPVDPATATYSKAR